MLKLTTTTLASTTTTTTLAPYNYCVEYGNLYNWYAATDPRNIAPSGWHLSTVQDLWDLMIAVDPDGGQYTNDAGGKRDRICTLSV